MVKDFNQDYRHDLPEMEKNYKVGIGRSNPLKVDEVSTHNDALLSKKHEWIWPAGLTSTANGAVLAVSVYAHPRWRRGGMEWRLVQRSLVEIQAMSAPDSVP